MATLPPVDGLSLRAFLAAAETKSFRAAAKRVALSPPAFSDRVRRLEDDLGVALFVRTTRTVRLTAEGESLKGAAAAALAALDACRQVVRAGPRPYALTIGTRFELGLSFLVANLDALEAVEPHRTIHLRFGDSDELLERTRTGEIDAALTSARLARSDLDYLPVHEEDYLFVGQRALLAKTPLARATDARHHVLVDAAPDLPLFRYFLDVSPDVESWRFARERYLGTIGAIHARVRAGRGVAVLPRYLVADDVKAGRLRPILRSRRLRTDTFRLLWRRGHVRDAELRRLAHELSRRPLT